MITCKDTLRCIGPIVRQRDIEVPYPRVGGRAKIFVVKGDDPFKNMSFDHLNFDQHINECIEECPFHDASHQLHDLGHCPLVSIISQMRVGDSIETYNGVSNAFAQPVRQILCLISRNPTKLHIRHYNRNYIAEQIPIDYYPIDYPGTVWIDFADIGDLTIDTIAYEGAILMVAKARTSIGFITFYYTDNGSKPYQKNNQCIALGYGDLTFPIISQNLEQTRKNFLFIIGKKALTPTTRVLDGLLICSIHTIDRHFVDSIDKLVL
jgi:hypothetical protein